MTSPARPLFHDRYGAALDDLPRPIRELHAISGQRSFTGTASIRRGRTLLARLLCRLAGFAPEGDAVALRLTITPDGTGERWDRWYGGHRMTSRLEAGKSPNEVVEHLGPATILSRLKPDEQGVFQPLVGFRILGVPMPGFVWPRADVREGVKGDRYAFRVRLDLPWGAPIVEIDGVLDVGLAGANPASQSRPPDGSSAPRA